MKYTCPVCGYFTFKESPGSYDICYICGWEDDEVQLRFIDQPGANRLSLKDYQRKYLEPSWVRKAKDRLFGINKLKVEKDSTWRPLRNNENFVQMLEYADHDSADSEDLEELYYWRRNK